MDFLMKARASRQRAKLPEHSVIKEIQMEITIYLNIWDANKTVVERKAHLYQNICQKLK